MSLFLLRVVTRWLFVILQCWVCLVCFLVCVCGCVCVCIHTDQSAWSPPVQLHTCIFFLLWQLYALISVWGPAVLRQKHSALMVYLYNIKSINQILKPLRRVLQIVQVIFTQMQCICTCVCMCVCKGCRQRPTLYYYLWNLQDYS